MLNPPGSRTATGRTGARRLVLLLLLALGAALVFAGLRDRENPVYPGVQIESKKTSLLEPGVICSAGIPVVLSPSSSGSLGFITASHCTDPSGAGNNVYQPYWSSGGDNNWAGWSIDRGTDDAYTEPNKNVPDAAVWVVANRGVSGKAPLSYCGLQDSTFSSVVAFNPTTVNLKDIFKIGRTTYCTGTWSSVTLVYDLRFSGKVYRLPASQLQAQPGDSGGIVFTIVPCGTTFCDIQAVGIFIGWTGDGSYALIQTADYALSYYGVSLYTGG